MNRIPCYIAAPYADADPAIQAWHVERACALARLAVTLDRAPIVVHPGIAHIYGPETRASRAVGLAVDEALLRLVAQTVRGELWLLLTDEGDMTSGVRREWFTWLRARSGRPPGRTGTWSDYQHAFSGAHLEDLWARLSVRPAQVVQQ